MSFWIVFARLAHETPKCPGVYFGAQLDALELTERARRRLMRLAVCRALNARRMYAPDQTRRSDSKTFFSFFLLGPSGATARMHYAIYRYQKSIASLPISPRALSRSESRGARHVLNFLPRLESLSNNWDLKTEHSLLGRNLKLR